MASVSTGDKPIRIEGKEGEYAEANKFTYDDKEKLLEMDGGVTVVSGKEYLYCDRLTADTDDKKYNFYGDVDGFVKYQKRGEPDVEPVESAPAQSTVVGQGTGAPPAQGAGTPPAE